MIDLNDAGLPSSFDNRRFYSRPPSRERLPEQLSLLPPSPIPPQVAPIKVCLGRARRPEPMWGNCK